MSHKSQQTPHAQAPDSPRANVSSFTKKMLVTLKGIPTDCTFAEVMACIMNPVKPTEIAQCRSYLNA